MDPAEAEFYENLFPAGNVDSEFRKTLFEIFESDPDFPSFPATVAQLQEKLIRSDTTFEEIAEIVRLDPGLAARIFALVRSAAFAGVEVADIETALFRLGLREARVMVMTSKLMDRFAHLRVKIDWNKFWVHSLLTARLTQDIANLFETVSFQQYLAGLMHDTGKVVLAHYFPKQFETVFRQVKATGRSMFKIEQKMLGTDHAAIGAALCYKWKLGKEIVYAIQTHHTWEENLLTNCLHAADSISNQCAENIHLKKAKGEPPENIEQHPIWQHFNQLEPRRSPETLSISKECAKAQDIVKAMLQGYAPPKFDEEEEENDPPQSLPMENTDTPVS